MSRNNVILRFNRNGNRSSSNGGGGSSSSTTVIIAENRIYGLVITGSTSTTLTTPSNYVSGTLVIFKNGVRYFAFTESSPNTITVSSRLIDDEFTIDYSIVSNPNNVYGEFTTGITSTTITLANSYQPNSICLYKNNARITGFTESTSNTIDLSVTPLTTDEFIIDYKKI